MAIFKTTMRVHVTNQELTEVFFEANSQREADEMIATNNVEVEDWGDVVDVYYGDTDFTELDYEAEAEHHSGSLSRPKLRRRHV
jgi:hypothetical protein